MNATDLRWNIAILLKKYVKRSKLRQYEIAVRLGITASAVCQMVTGKMSMTFSQLNELSKILKLSDDEIYELRSLLVKLRSNGNNLKSPFNIFMRACRRRKHYNLYQLSKATGIQRPRLVRFENDVEFEFTEDDANKLGEVLGVSSAELLAKAPKKVEEIETTNVAEDSTPYTYQLKLTFEQFTKNIVENTLNDYIEKAKETGANSILVVANTYDLDIILRGEMSFVLPFDTDNLNSSTYIVMDENQKFHILEERAQSAFFYALSKVANKKYNKNLAWFRPISEIIIKPKGIA